METVSSALKPIFSIDFIFQLIRRNYATIISIAFSVHFLSLESVDFMT
jgi:hypothetical protein